MADIDDVQHYIDLIEAGNYSFLDNLQGNDLLDTLSALGSDLGSKGGDAGKAAMSKLADQINGSGSLLGIYNAQGDDELATVKDRKAVLEMFGKNENGVYFTPDGGTKSLDESFNESLDWWHFNNPSEDIQDLKITALVVNAAPTREEILDSIGVYEPQTLESLELTPNKLRTMANTPEKDGEPSPFEDLMPEQLVAADAFFGQLTVGKDNDLRLNFNKYCDRKLENYTAIPGIESAPAMRELITRRGTENGALTTAGIKAADRLAQIVQEFDQENNIEGVTAEQLTTNMAAIEGFSANFEPFAEDADNIAPEAEIAVLTEDEAKAKLAQPESLSIGDIAAIDKAMVNQPEDSAERKATKDLKLKAIKDVASGKVKIGKDIKSMQYILGMGLPDDMVSSAKKAESKLKETLLEGQKRHPLIDKDFEELRDVMNAMDFRGDMGVLGRKKLSPEQQAEVQQSIIEAAELRATRQLAGSKDPVTAEAWKNALKDSMHAVLFEAYAADQAAKGNTDPAKVSEGFAKLAEMGKNGKSVKINRDSVAATMAAAQKSSKDFASRLGQKLGKLPAVEGLKTKVKSFDQKCSKRFGKNYEKAKSVLNFVGKAAWGATKTYGLYTLAATFAPVGIPALMAYNMGKKMVEMRKGYLNKKENNPELKLKDYWKSRDSILGMAGTVLSAAAMIIPGMQLAGVENLGEISKIPWVKALNASRPLIGMGLATMPKAFDAIFAKKGERKKAWKEFGAAAAGIVTGYLFNQGLQTGSQMMASEPAVADNSNEVDGLSGAAMKSDANQGPSYVYDKESGASVIHHDPNQEAFERGEFDQANREAVAYREEAAAQEAAALAAATAQAAVSPSLEPEARMDPGPELVAPANPGVSMSEPVGDILEQYGRLDNVEKTVGEAFSHTQSGMEAEQTKVVMDRYLSLVGEGKVDEAQLLMAAVHQETGGGEYIGSEMQKIVDTNLGIHHVDMKDADVRYSIEGGEIMLHGEHNVERDPNLESKIGGNATQEEIKNLQLSDKIYTDMQERAQLGEQLQPEEKEFMAFHEKNLAATGVTHEDINGVDTLAQEAIAETRLEEKQNSAAEMEKKLILEGEGQTYTTTMNVAEYGKGMEEAPIAPDKDVKEAPIAPEKVVDVVDKQDEKTVVAPEQSQGNTHSTVIGGDSVTYKIGDDGKLSVTGSVQLDEDLRQQLLADDKAKYEKGEIGANQYSMSRDNAALDAKALQMQDNVYTDVKEREVANMQPASEAEKQFLQQHEKTMEKLGREAGSLSGEDKLGKEAAAASRAETPVQHQEKNEQASGKSVQQTLMEKSGRVSGANEVNRVHQEGGLSKTINQQAQQQMPMRPTRGK